MGICASKQESKQPQPPLIVKPPMVKQHKAQFNEPIHQKLETTQRPDCQLQVPVHTNSENSKQDLNNILNKSVELFQLENQLIYRNGKFFNNYSLLNNVALGINGKVFIVQHNSTGMKRAAKIVKITSKFNELTVMTQVQQMKKLDHPNLIKICDYFKDNTHQYLVSEFCEGGDILSRLQKQQTTMTELQIINLFHQILSGLQYLHMNKLVHKNIAPDNILYAQPNTTLIKLIDFGLFRLNLKSESFEDYRYQAPETFLNNQYTSKSDIWSCGILLYQFVTGIIPFQGATKKATINNIKKGVLNPGNDWEKLNPEVKNLIFKMLSFDPKQRPKAIQCINSPFLKRFFNDKTEVLIKNNALFNLKQFKNTCLLQQVLLTCMIDHMMTKHERDELAIAFRRIDKNGDGRISREEMLQELLMNLKPDAAASEVDKLFKQLDTNQSGSIEFNEFLVATCDKRKFLTTRNLNEFFKLIDRNHSHSINLKELKKLFINLDLDSSIWIQLFRQADENGDGEISLDEFHTLMLKQD